MDNENNNAVSSGSIKLDEYFISNLIDIFLGKLRNGYLLNFFESNQKALTQYGLYGLYLSALVGLIMSVTIPIKYDAIEWETSLTYGFGFSFLCTFAHYIAVKFLPNIDSILSSTPSLMSSNSFLDVFAVLFFISGICFLLGGIGMAISKESFEEFIYGLFGFIFCEYLLALCLKPELLNISIQKNTSSAQELLGVVSFFFKSALKLVPIIFGTTIIFGLLSLLGMPFEKFYYVSEITDFVSGIGYIYIGALAPIFGYMMFLLYYFIIDIIMAVLSLSKLDR